MTQIDWSEINRADAYAIALIARRADGLLDDLDRVTLSMDISAVHLQHALGLTAFLTADESDFLHDVSGITRHMNRSTGTLGDHFRPKCTLPESEATP